MEKELPKNEKSQKLQVKKIENGIILKKEETKQNNEIKEPVIKVIKTIVEEEPKDTAIISNPIITEISDEFPTIEEIK